MEGPVQGEVEMKGSKYVRQSEQNQLLIVCNCGCGAILEKYNNGFERSYIYGHQRIGKKHSEETRLQLSGSWDYSKHVTESFKIKQKSRMIGNTNTLGFIPTLESRLKMRNARLGKKGSDEMRDKMRTIRLNRVMPSKDSKPEKIIQLNLKLMGIDFKKHVSISGQPDIFVEPNNCIFIDGCYWHVCKNENCEIGKLNLKRELKDYQIDKMINDLKINEILKTNGYNVIRIWEHDIKNNLGYVLDNLEIILKHTGVEIKNEK